MAAQLEIRDRQGLARPWTSSWCPAQEEVASQGAPDHQLVAVIGVLSHEGREGMRQLARSTWMRSAAGETLRAWFVMRGIGAAAPVLQEAAEHGDVFLLNASAALTRTTGPLHSLFLWLRCATSAFSAVPFVGKMDDDAWLHPTGMAALLRSMLPWLDRPFSAFVRSFEAFSWDLTTGLPVAWAGRAVSPNWCRVRSSTFNGSVGGTAGPFSFAKGAAFFLSMRLASVVAGAGLPAEEDPRCLEGSRCHFHGDDATDDADGRHSTTDAELPPFSCGVSSHQCSGGPKHDKPWEDVWLGMALSRARRAENVATVHLNSEQFHDEWGFKSRPTALVWHSRLDTDIHRRYPTVHAWGMAGARCAEGPYEVRCRRRQNGRGVPYLVHTCANNSWMNCHVVRRDDATNCSREEVDLWSWSAERNSTSEMVVLVV